jgi:hypothetical protein
MEPTGTGRRDWYGNAEMPDALLPSQMFGAPLCAEHRLMLAVLIDAINLVANGRESHECRETIDWIGSDVAATAYGWSFLTICTELDLDPARLRRQIAALGELDLRGRISRTGDCGRRIVAEREAVQ